MNLNQVTVTMPNLDDGWTFYSMLGLVPVVNARPSALSALMATVPSLYTEGRKLVGGDSGVFRM